MRALAPSPSLSPSLPRAPSPPLAPSPPQVSMTFEWERLVVKGRDETTDEWGEPRSTSSRASSPQGSRPGTGAASRPATAGSSAPPKGSRPMTPRTPRTLSDPAAAAAKAEAAAAAAAARLPTARGLHGAVAVGLTLFVYGGQTKEGALLKDEGGGGGGGGGGSGRVGRYADAMEDEARSAPAGGLTTPRPSSARPAPASARPSSARPTSAARSSFSAVSAASYTSVAAMQAATPPNRVKTLMPKSMLYDRPSSAQLFSACFSDRPATAPPAAAAGAPGAAGGPPGSARSACQHSALLLSAARSTREQIGMAGAAAHEGAHEAPRLLDDLWLCQVVAIGERTELICSRPETRGARPGPRSLHSMVATGARIFVHGGVGTLPPAPPTASTPLHYLKGMVSFGSAGSEVGAPPRAIKDLFVLSTRDLTWSHLVGGGPPAPRHAHCAIALPRRLLVLGGVARGRPSDEGGEAPRAEMYDADTCAWSVLPLCTAPASAAVLASAVSAAAIAAPAVPPGASCAELGSGAILIVGGLTGARDRAGASAPATRVHLSSEPRLSSLEPKEGSVVGGTPLLLHGHNLHARGAVLVKFTYRQHEGGYVVGAEESGGGTRPSERLVEVVVGGEAVGRDGRAVRCVTPSLLFAADECMATVEVACSDHVPLNQQWAASFDAAGLAADVQRREREGANLSLSLQRAAGGGGGGGAEPLRRAPGGAVPPPRWTDDHLEFFLRGETCLPHCTFHGAGLKGGLAGVVCHFSGTANDVQQRQRSSGGDKFELAIRAPPADQAAAAAAAEKAAAAAAAAPKATSARAQAQARAQALADREAAWAASWALQPTPARDHGDGTYSFAYTLNRAGKYTMCVLHPRHQGGRVPLREFEIEIEAAQTVASMCIVEGLHERLPEHAHLGQRLDESGAPLEPLPFAFVAGEPRQLRLRANDVFGNLTRPPASAWSVGLYNEANKLVRRCGAGGAARARCAPLTLTPTPTRLCRSHPHPNPHRAVPLSPSPQPQPG